MSNRSDAEIRLEAELTRALDIPLGEMYKTGLRAHVAAFPELSLAVRSVLSEQQEPRLDLALIAVMREAIKLIPDIAPKYAGRSANINTREIASILCGLVNDLPLREEGGRYTYKELRAIAIERAGFDNASASTFQRKIATPIKRALAEVLVNRQAKLTKAVGFAGPPLVSKPLGSSYVCRPTIEAEFHAAVKSGANLIVLLGQRGCGKSTLARKLVEEVGLGRSWHFVSIDCESDTAFHRDIARALSRAGVSTSDKDSEGLIREFTSFLESRSRERSVVLLDDVATLLTANTLISEDAQTLWIVVSNSVTPPRWSRQKVINVGAMTLDEGGAMARKLIDAHLATDRECRVLAHNAGRLPSAIQHAATIIGAGYLKVDEFVDQHYESPLVAYRDPSNDLRVDLVETYRQLASSLRERHKEAWLVLGLIVVAMSPGMAFRVCKDYLREVFTILWDEVLPETSARGEFALAIGTRDLVEMGILANADPRRGPNMWEVNRLVGELIHPFVLRSAEFGSLDRALTLKGERFECGWPWERYTDVSHLLPNVET